MNSMAAQAKTKGELVFGYKQGAEEYNYKDIGPWGNVRNGYCAAMSMKWMAARLNKSNLDFNQSSLEGAKQDWKITKWHNLTKEKGGYDDVMGSFGIKRDKSLAKDFPGAPQAGSIVHFVGIRPGLYMLQYKRKGGGHMVAMENDIDEFGYFDANFGHFKFNSMARFLAWYKEFLVKSGYEKRYGVKTIVTQVTE